MSNMERIFDGVVDPRSGNATRYDLNELLLSALMCVMCGGQTCTDMALFVESRHPVFMQFGLFKNGPPSHDTYSRLFRIIDPESLHQALTRLSASLARRLNTRVVAIDGKTIRRSFEDASKRSPLHVVNAFAVGAGLTLGQVRVDGKSNEISAMPALLALFDVAGLTVTADAMHTQRTTAETIVKKGGHYALALKGNQETLYRDVQIHLAEALASGHAMSCEDVDKGHGRIEIREASISHDVTLLQDLHHWPGLQAVGQIRTTREKNGKPSTQTRYFLLSKPLTPERFLETVRSHWAVESLHWVLDVTMREDDLRNRKDHGPENLSIMRKLALNLARITDGGKTKSMRGKLKKAAWSDAFLLNLIASAQHLADEASSEKIHMQ